MKAKFIHKVEFICNGVHHTEGEVYDISEDMFERYGKMFEKIEEKEMSAAEKKAASVAKGQETKRRNAKAKEMEKLLAIKEAADNAAK